MSEVFGSLSQAEGAVVQDIPERDAALLEILDSLSQAAAAKTQDLPAHHGALPEVLGSLSQTAAAKAQDFPVRDVAVPGVFGSLGQAAAAEAQDFPDGLLALQQALDCDFDVSALRDDMLLLTGPWLLFWCLWIQGSASWRPLRMSWSLELIVIPPSFWTLSRGSRRSRLCVTLGFRAVSTLQRLHWRSSARRADVCSTVGLRP